MLQLVDTASRLGMAGPAAKCVKSFQLVAVEGQLPGRRVIRKPLDESVVLQLERGFKDAP